MVKTDSMDKKSYFDPFVGQKIEAIIPITQAQTEIWTACKFGGNNANRAYNDSVTITLKGDVNSTALEGAFNQLIDRHQSLRASFSRNGRFMIVFEKAPLKIQFHDLSHLNRSEADAKTKAYLRNDANFIFDLEKLSLVKVGLLKYSPEHYNLIVTAHHIICDGWSVGILLEEIGALYSRNLYNTDAHLPKPEKFSDYADEQVLFEKSKESKVSEEFWRNQFSDNVPQVEMPIDFKRPALRTFNSARLDFQLDKGLLNEIKKVGVGCGASLVSTLLTVFELLISQLTGQNDIVIGLPTAGQAFSERTQMIGHSVNLLPLRSKIPINIPFETYLKTRKQKLFDAYEHQNLSFGQLLQKLPVQRDPSRIPLVPVVFNIDMGMTEDVKFEGLAFKTHNNPRNFEAFELFVNASGTNDELLFEWSFNTSLFDPSTIRNMMDLFQSLISKIVKAPSQHIGSIIYQNLSCYHKLNDTKIEYSEDTLTKQIWKQAQNTPQKTAIEFNGTKISYDSLWNETKTLAELLKEHGVLDGDAVGVSLPRSEYLVPLLLALMECGAAYVPLDPSYPIKRLDYMLKDSKAKFLITTKKLGAKFPNNANTLFVEKLLDKNTRQTVADNDLINNNSAQTAYILYTSGSTGNPKGVQISNKNLVNFLNSMAKEPGIKETDRLLAITSISFDIAGLELFLPLICGATLVLIDDEKAKDGRILLKTIEAEDITMMQATPSTWQMLLDSGWKNPLRLKALAGGEALPQNLAEKLISRTTELWNMYGPTETTIWSSTKRITSDDKSITIGRPIANTQIYILNEEGFPLGPGITGEVAIGGAGLAKGYWNRLDLTQSKFVYNTYVNDHLYLTGDLGRLLRTNEIQCLGRKDHQIKVRGYRVELEEIENALEAIPEIQSAIVTLQSNQLKAFVVLEQNTKTPANFNKVWRKVLSDRLPDYMVPFKHVVIDEFPTTLNGKIDRKALLSIDKEKEGNEPVSLRTSDLEKTIIGIWEECLQLKDIKPDQNFFELGGHSMIAVKMMTLVEDKTGTRLPLATLLECPTIRGLANFMEKEDTTPQKLHSLVPIKPNGSKTPLFIVHGANYNVLVFEKLAQYLDEDQPVYGLQARGIDGSVEPDDTVEKMASNFIREIQSIYPEGPYSLAGFSFGGIIVYEMYRQLKSKRIEVKILSLFDSYVYPNYYFKSPTIKKITYQCYFLGHLAFMGLNMFSNKKNFKRRIHLLKIKLRGIYLRLRHGRQRQMQEQFNRNSKIDEMHTLAFYRYSIEPSEVIVDLFRASENVYFAHDFKYLGWKGIAKKGIRKHKIPGNHNDMLLSPNVEVFAERLQHTLDNNESG